MTKRKQRRQKEKKENREGRKEIGKKKRKGKSNDRGNE